MFEEKCPYKKLKKDAIPTIFDHTNPPKRRKPPRRVIETVAAGDISSLEHNYHHNILAEKEQPESATPLDEIDTNILTPMLFDVHGENDKQQNVGVSEQDVKQLKMMIIDLEEKLKKAEVNIATLNREKRRLLKGMDSLREAIPKFLNEDQIRYLKVGNMQGVSWSPATINKSLQLLFSCGSNGYETLLQFGYPLPCIRTLQRRMENLSFESGILVEVFDMLKVKVQELDQNERLCCLTLDEMSIQPGCAYDNRHNYFVGNIDLPDHEGVASKVLVCMLSGLQKRWKQVVGYYYTGNETDGSVLKPIINEIICLAHGIGLEVVGVTSDMGSPNQKMWKSFEITCTRNSCVNKVENPADPSKMYFLADVPQLIKT